MLRGESIMLRINHGRKYHAENKEQLNAYQLKYKYGITVEERYAMAVKQNWRCACCSRQHNVDNFSKKTGLHVDHNHRTGEVRALVCRTCNPRIGVAEAPIYRHYLEKYGSSYDNPKP